MSDTNINRNKRLHQLAESPVGKLLWQYSLPAVVGMLVVSLYNVADRVFIGQGVGPEAIAGLAVTLPVMNLSAAFGVLVGGGAAARISVMLGAGDTDNAFRTLGNALVMSVSIAIAYITVFALFLDDILMAFGASAATLPYAHEFMVYMLPGFLLINVSLSFNNIMRASGYPMKAMIANFIGAGINVALDPIFIFWLDMGIKGASIATVISMAISGIYVMMHFCRRDSTIHFRRGIYRLEGRIVWGIVAIGAAPSLINAAASAVNAIINNSLLHYGGDTAVAAAGIFTTLSTLAVMAMSGISQGMQPIVGYNYGAGHFHRMKHAYYLAVAAASVVALISTAVGDLIPDLWARAFTTSEALIDTTVNAFHLGFWAFWLVGYQVISTTFFQSIGKAGKSIFLSLARQVIFLIPLMLLLPRTMQLDGVWLAFPLGDVAATVCTVALIIYQWRIFARIPANPSSSFRPQTL